MIMPVLLGTALAWGALPRLLAGIPAYIALAV
jgi:hypothetical protein